MSNFIANFFKEPPIKEEIQDKNADEIEWEEIEDD